jgi:beta-glucanase (GH16 family)
MSGKIFVCMAALVFFTHAAGYGQNSNRIISSGRVNTQNKFTFQYGKIEASIKLPKTADGLWPAFWLLGADFADAGWPECGEIDVLEMGSKAGIDNNVQEKYFNGAVHWGKVENGNHPNYAVSAVNEYSLQDGKFHLYALVWDRKSIRMYLDGNARPYFERILTPLPCALIFINRIT